MNPSPHIYTLLNGSSTNWENVSSRITAHPEEIRWRDGRDEYCFLHIACFGFTNKVIPTHIIREIIDAYPEAMSIPVKGGWLPLHLAMLYESPLEIVRVLLDAYKNAISVCNDACNLPLHNALWQRLRAEQVDIVRMILEAFPEACGDEYENQNSQSAWDLVCASWLEDAERMELDANKDLQGYLCEITMLVLRARFEQRHKKRGDDKVEFMPLHAILREQGGKLFNMNEIVRQYFMDQCGDTASVPNGKDGRFCLQVAVENGMDWNSSDANGGALCAIYDAAAVVVDSRDIKTGLYPFQVAAVDNRCDLDAIFNLMRPCVGTGCFRSINTSSS